MGQQSTRRVRDTYTNDTYEIPWNDSRRPTDTEIEELINQQKRATAPPPEPTLFQKIDQPLLKWASPIAHKISDKLTMAGLNQLDKHVYDKDSTLGKFETWNRENIINPVAGFAGGALEGAGDMIDNVTTNPIDVTSELLTFGGAGLAKRSLRGYQAAVRALKSAEEVNAAAKAARLGTMAAKAGSAVTAGRGAYNMGDAISGDEEGNTEWGKLGTGALELALSGHGYHEAGKTTRVADSLNDAYKYATSQMAEDATKPASRVRNPDQKALPSGRVFYGFGDVVADGSQNPNVMRQIADEADRRGITIDSNGRVMPTRKAPNVDIASRDPNFVQDPLEPTYPKESRAARRERIIKNGNSLPDIDIAPLKSEIVPPEVIAAEPVVTKTKARGKKAKAPSKQKSSADKGKYFSEDPELNDEGIYFDESPEQIKKEMNDPRNHLDDRAGDRADAEAEARTAAEAKPKPTIDRPYVNMEEPILTILVKGGDKKAIQELAHRRGETGSLFSGRKTREPLMKEGFVDDVVKGARGLGARIKTGLGNFISDETGAVGPRKPKNPNEPTIKKDPDFSYNGEHNIKFPNGIESKMFYDQASQTWYHTGEHADKNVGNWNPHHSTEWAHSKQELVDKIHKRLDPESFMRKNASPTDIPTNRNIPVRPTDVHDTFEASGKSSRELVELANSHGLEVKSIQPNVNGHFDIQVRGDRMGLDRFNESTEVPFRPDPQMPETVVGSLKHLINDETGAVGSLPPRRVRQDKKPRPTTRAEILKGMPESQDTRSGLRKFFDDTTKSGLSQLEDMGPAGKEISRKMQYMRAEANHEAGLRINQINETIKDFSMDERTNLFDVLDGTAKPVNDRVKYASTVARKVLNETGDAAEKIGMKLELPSGKKVPFTKMKGDYAPHVFDDAFFQGQNKENLFNTLVKEGKSSDEANRIIQAIKNYGDRLIDPQHTRSLNLKGYRRDPDAIHKYLGDMWQKIGEGKHLGVGDLSDTSTPISQLVKQTNNPQLAHRILNGQLGRVIHDASLEQAVHGINSAQVAAKLPLFAISNLSQRATPLLKAGMTDYVKAIKSTLFDNANSKTRAEISGSLQAVNKQLFQDSGGEGRISRLFQMRRSETANRVFASEVGRNTVETVFDKVKKNPADKMARKRLDDLLLEDVDKVIKQDKLTDKQKSIASYRMNELTQGITDNIDLPVLWNGHPSVKLLTLFRKFSFVQTKIIKDAIKENPSRNIPIALLAYMAAGEAVGDAKTAINSVISGEDPIEKIKDRGEYKTIGKITSRIMGDDTGAVVGRLAQDVSDGFALGLLDDALTSSFGGKPSGFTEFLGGVTVGDASRLAGGVATGIQNIGKDDPTDTFMPLVKEGVKTLPFGRSIAKRIWPPEETGSGRPIHPRHPSR